MENTKIKELLSKLDTYDDCYSENDVIELINEVEKENLNIINVLNKQIYHFFKFLLKF